MPAEFLTLRLRIRQALRVQTLALVALLDCLSHVVAVPHARGGVLSVATEARSRWLAGIDNNTTINGKSLAHWLRVVLAKTVLESALDTFVDVLRDVSTAISHHVAVTAGSITIVFQSSGFFAAIQPFELAMHAGVHTGTSRVSLESCLDVSFGRI